MSFCFCAVVGAAAVAPANEPSQVPACNWSAKWIWRDKADVHAYNQTVIARRQFQLERPTSGRLRITADSFYRLYVNGTWVNDGPSRCWPEHFQYDEIDVGAYLRDGLNELRVVARYYGVGDFHRVPKQAGLLAQLDVVHAGGKAETIASDGSWEIAEAAAWLRNTPKVSIQMEPAELYDARLEEPLQFAPAKVLFDADDGPWRDLNPRDVALLTRQPVAFKTFLGAKVVKCDGLNFCLPAARLVHPGVIEANNHVSCACGMATILEVPAACSLVVQNENMNVAIDGRQAKDGRFSLEPGRHLVLAFVRNIFGHDKEKSLRFLEPAGLKLENPLDPRHANPWCFIRFPEYAVAKNDLLWMPFTSEDPELTKATEGYNAASKELLTSVKMADDFRKRLASRAEVMPAEQMFVEDVHWQFRGRQVVGDAAPLVDAPAALMHESPSVTTVRPSPQGDVELLYDLGEQNVGYYAFELIADAGVAVDIFSLEYIAPDGRLQHSGGNRNGMRYITRQGVNQFTSLKRRSGRYVFITLRNQKTPVQIRNFRLIESTYPLNYVGSFACSDARLDRIWEIDSDPEAVHGGHVHRLPAVRTDPLGRRRAERIAAGLPGLRHDRHRPPLHPHHRTIAGALSARRLPDAVLLGRADSGVEPVVGHLGVGPLLVHRRCRGRARVLARGDPQSAGRGAVRTRAGSVQRSVLELLRLDADRLQPENGPAQLDVCRRRDRRGAEAGGSAA